VATYPAGGTVVFQDGTPVTFGSVEFYHAGHDLTSRGTIQPDGSFQLGTYAEDDGAPAGEHQVVVTQLIVPAEAGITPRDHGRHVAQKYARYETSNLRLQVTPGGSSSLRIVVQAESEGGRPL
jgi:hypothetical protein